MPKALKKGFLIILLGFIFFAGNVLAAESDDKTIVPENLTIPILCYHAVSDNKSIYTFSPKQLEEDLKYLKEHDYRPITALQLMRMRDYPEYFPPKPIVLSFDDGNKSAYLHVLPLLKKYGFQATFFVYPGDIREKSKRCLTWKELSEIALAGMDIESHTMTHPYLTINNKDNRQSYLNWLSYELKGSKDILETKLRRKVTLLAYPFGWYNSEVEAAAIKAGYQGMFTVNWGNNGINDNPYRFKRRVMVNTLSFTEFERVLTARPLEVNVVSPADTAIVNVKPVIKFSLSNPEIKTVELSIRRTKVTLMADSQGVFTVSRFPAPKPRGYCMIIIKGYDDAKHLYMSSWGFDYEPVQNSL